MADPELTYYTKAESNTFLVAEDKETMEIAGCVATTRMSQDRMELHRLIVSPKYQVIINCLAPIPRIIICICRDLD